MGRKVHPIGFRLNINQPWLGRWYAEGREYTEQLHQDFAIRRLIQAEAEKAGVILGLEDTNSAEDNVRIIDRAGSAALQVYYDVGNSTGGGFDVIKEIRWLGARRICQIHLKDNPHYLGEGKIDFPAVMKAIAEIRFAGFANLETDCPTKSVEADMARNLKFIRGLMA